MAEDQNPPPAGSRDRRLTQPEGSRAHFGSVVLGLYDKQGRLIHVGQAGSGFNQQSLAEISQLLKKTRDQAEALLRRR